MLLTILEISYYTTNNKNGMYALARLIGANYTYHFIITACLYFVTAPFYCLYIKYI